MRIAICDDNPEEAGALEALLQDFSKAEQIPFVIEIFPSGFLFLDAISEQKRFELCFLDIFMSSFSGLDTAKELRLVDKNMQLIFCTSAPQYALDGYKVQACNYLVKPVEKDSIFLAMEEVLRRIRRGKEDHYLIPTGSGFQRLSKDLISYAQPEGNFTRVFLRDKTQIHAKIPFSQLCSHLGTSPNFAQISRSTLLNYDSVVGMEREDFFLENGVKICIPRRKKKEITQGFLDYSMGG